MEGMHCELHRLYIALTCCEHGGQQGQMICPGSADHAANEVAYDVLMNRRPSTVRVPTGLGGLENLRDNLACKLFPWVMCYRSRHLTPPLPNGREMPNPVHQEAA